MRERYTKVKEPATFKEKDVVKNTLTIYYNVLNIVATRMRDNPEARITLCGATDGRELPTTSQRRKLAEERAAEVKDYLTSTWGLASERISITTLDIPQLHSNPAYNEGLEENRRVEISSVNPKILAPVVNARFLEYTPIQSKQVFSVKALRPEKAQSWDASIRKNDNVSRVSGHGALPGMIPFSVDSSVMVAIGREIHDKDSLDALLKVLQNDGSTVTATCRFPIIKTQNQFELSRLTLIVFDFDRSDISEANKEMMQTFIKEALHPDSRIAVTGSTDRLGELDYNKTLSQSRADEAKIFLTQLQSDAHIESCIGIGASRLPYNNDLPEGRYYCRTVSIVVQTPRIK
jgi:outer membrane protein OmpA-like peptidoglycan-associated protein